MATLNVTYNFTNGNIAEAGQVNQNFDDVELFASTKVVQIDGSVKAPTIAIADAAITNAKIDYTSVVRTTVSSTEPASPKAGDVWVQI